ncbi:MAG: ATP-grasp domain-containing protein [Candidatus Hodarchaeales archaeon]|jgi:hypothetical protein
MSEYEKTGSFVELLGSPVVFMHDINTLPRFSKIISSVDGIERYERTIPIARTEDVVITKNHPESSYLQWLENVGLGSKKIIVLNGNKTETLPERIMKNGMKKHLNSLLGNKKKKVVISPYYGGPLEYQASNYLELEMYAETKLVKKYDSKINFKNKCRKIGVPVIEDELFTFESKHRMKELVETIKDKLDETGKAIVKGEFGASASTTYLFDGMKTSLIEEIAANSKQGDRYSVESFYNTLSNPSSVWFVSKDRKIVHLKTSNQLLDNGTSHAGNEFPVEFDEELIQKITYKIAKNLCQEGFIGPFGIDYLETKKGMFASECNPRVTGAMYPWELVHRIDKNGTIKAARAKNIHLPRKRLRFKDLIKIWNDILYNGHDGAGTIVPFNVGPIAEGKVTVLGMGSSKAGIERLFEDISDSLLEKLA